MEKMHNFLIIMLKETDNKTWKDKDIKRYYRNFLDVLSELKLDSTDDLIKVLRVGEVFLGNLIKTANFYDNEYAKLYIRGLYSEIKKDEYSPAKPRFRIISSILYNRSSIKNKHRKK